MTDTVCALIRSPTADSLRNAKINGCIAVRLFTSGGDVYYSVTGPSAIIETLPIVSRLSPDESDDVVPVRTSGRPPGAKNIRQAPLSSPEQK